jgi:hypothetical protein
MPFRMKLHLEPIAIATNVAQKKSTRADQVALMLANLYFVFMDDAIEVEVRDGIHHSLEKRWANSDQEVFILAIFFNPYIRGTCFRLDNPYLNQMGLYNMAKRLYQRIFSTTGTFIDLDFHDAFFDYYHGRHEFTPEYMGLDEMRLMAQRDVCVRITFYAFVVLNPVYQGDGIDLVRIWNRFDSQTTKGRHGVIKMAIHILSIVVNSADCERLFSGMGITHSKLRNRLGVESTRKIMKVKMDEKRLLAGEELQRRRKKRKFGSSCEDSETASNNTAEQSDEPLDFGIMLENMSADTDNSEEENEDGLPPANLLASPTSLKEWLRLKHMFRYEKNSGLDFYWQSAISNLDHELELYDLQAAQESEAEIETAGGL